MLGGGGLSSRIADRLRQKGGISYSAASIFSADSFDRYGPMMVFAIYNPINVQKVRTGVDEEVDRLLRDGVSAAELDRARTGLLQQQQVQRSNDRMLALLLGEDLYVGRTMRFQAEFEQKIRELTPEAVNAALRKYLDPEEVDGRHRGRFQEEMIPGPLGGGSPVDGEHEAYFDKEGISLPRGMRVEGL